MDQSDEQNLEYHAPWYRWQTTVTADQLKTMVDQFLAGYANEHKELISMATDSANHETEAKTGSEMEAKTGSETEAKTGSETKTKMGSEKKSEALPETLGSIRQITVLERSGSGYVNRLRIEGDEGTMEILRPGTVRQLLGNTDLVYEKRDRQTLLTEERFFPVQRFIWKRSGKEKPLPVIGSTAAAMAMALA